MKETKQETIEIDNIHLSAYLLARKIRIVGVTRSGRMGVFAFDAKKATPEIQTYMGGKALIDPRAFANAIRELKRMTDEALARGNANSGGAQDVQ